MLLVKIFPSSLPYPRFGVVLKKGILKKAVDRNRVRRAIFDSLQPWITSAPAVAKDFLVIARTPLIRLPIPELKKEVAAAFDRIVTQR